MAPTSRPASFKLGRNDSCPCGSGAKYKKCCERKGVPWERYIRDRDPRLVAELTARGRNLAFLRHVAGTLQLDRISAGNWSLVKRACSNPATIRTIHEAVIGYWPSVDDLVRVLEAEKSNEAGLYVGSYEPAHIFRGITRHAVYSDSIILMDPFLDARIIAERFNPILHPSMYVTATLKNLRLWLTLAPWIEAGLVKFVPSPTGFDAGLARAVIKSQQRKFRENEELGRVFEEPIEVMETVRRSFQEYGVFHTPDDVLARQFRERNPAVSDADVAGFLAEVARAREESPYYVAGSIGVGPDQGEINVTTSGESYPVAKMVAATAGAHLITDLPSKWKEIEIDQREIREQNRNWTPFAKAFNGVDFKCLEEVPMEAALRLRQENRLDGMRTFLRKVWRACKADDDFKDENAQALTEELTERIDEAEREWKTIDADLLKQTREAAVLAAAPILGSASVGIGTGTFLAGAATFVARMGIAVSGSIKKHRQFDERYPAAFFLDLQKRR